MHSDLAGTNVGSPRYLGVGGNASNYARRKSDSRLDSSQIAHLQKVYAASNTCIDQLGIERESGTTNRNTVEGSYQSDEMWSQQNYNSGSSRRASACRSDYADFAYNAPLALGPFQIIPAQIRRHQQTTDREFCS